MSKYSDQTEDHFGPRATVSVVVPTCDRPQEVKAALTSVFRQSFSDLEVFVVDNGVHRVVPDILEMFPRLRYFRIPPHAGASVARNWGAMHSSGRYLAFLDDDDVWPDDYLTTMVSAIDSSGLGLIAAPNRDIATGATIAVPIPIPSDRPLEQWRALAYMGSNMVIRADAFWSVGGFPARIVTGEDRALVIKLHLAGVPIGRCADTFVFRNMASSDRLTSSANLLLGKLSFLAELRDTMPRRERDDDQLAFLIYLSRSWGWPVWLIGAIYAPRAALRRGEKLLMAKLRGRVGKARESRESPDLF